MAFRKKFSRSERAALLGLAELFKAGFISQEFFDFQQMTLQAPEEVHFGGSHWVNRYVEFVSIAGTVRLLVRTASYVGDPTNEELETWTPDQVEILSETGTCSSVHLLRRSRPIPHWSGAR